MYTPTERKPNELSETRRHFQHVCSGGSTPHLKTQTHHRPEVLGLTTPSRLPSGATDHSLHTDSRALYQLYHGWELPVAAPAQMQLRCKMVTHRECASYTQWNITHNNNNNNKALLYCNVAQLQNYAKCKKPKAGIRPRHKNVTKLRPGLGLWQ